MSEFDALTPEQESEAEALEAQAKAEAMAEGQIGSDAPIVLVDEHGYAGSEPDPRVHVDAAWLDALHAQAQLGHRIGSLPVGSSIEIEQFGHIRVTVGGTHKRYGHGASVDAALSQVGY